EGLILREEGAHLRGEAAVARQTETDDGTLPAGDSRKPLSAHEEMRKDGSASQSRARGIAAANVLQVVGRGRADGDAGRRREELTGPWWNVTSRKRINIAQAER